MWRAVIQNVRVSATNTLKHGISHLFLFGAFAYHPSWKIEVVSMNITSTLPKYESCNQRKQGTIDDIYFLENRAHTHTTFSWEDDSFGFYLIQHNPCVYFYVIPEDV